MDDDGLKGFQFVVQSTPPMTFTWSVNFAPMQQAIQAATEAMGKSSVAMKALAEKLQDKHDKLYAATVDPELVTALDTPL